jgi:hypothetical protein
MGETRRCAFCLRHEEDLLEIQLGLEMGNGTDELAAWPEFPCPTCPLMSVALGAHR